MFTSLLGLGQGGSNLADLWVERGNYAACINFSQNDLDSLEHVDKKLCLVGSNGIGKVRSNAIKLMNNNWDLAINFVKENFSHPSIEIIFVPFSTGGGSGSGMSPIVLSLLQQAMPEKIFVALPIIPDKNEAYTNQKNCLETFEDLSRLDISILPIDNEKGRKLVGNLGKNILYKNVNESVINSIENLVCYTEMSSKYGVLDRNDLKSIFRTKGLCTIGEASISMANDKLEIDGGFSYKVKKSWEKSLFADIEYKRIISAGFIFEGQEKLMDFINTEKIFSCFDNKMPINLFEGLYTIENQNITGKITTVLTGLAWCHTRLKEIENILESKSEIIDKLEENDVYVSNVKRVQSSHKDVKKGKSMDISSLINQFKR